MSVHPSDRRITVPDETNTNRSKFQKSLLLITTITVIAIGIILIVYIIRQDSNSKTITIIQENSAEEHEKVIYNDCIDIIWENRLRHNFNQSNPEHVQPIRIKVFNTLRRLTSIYKRDLILFLYEYGFIRMDIPAEERLNLHGADLNNIQFENVNLDYLYLPGVIARNSRFSNCQLKKSNFQGSVMNNTRFIACSLDESTFSDASLKRTSFTSSTALSTINFNNADLLDSQIKTSELNNKELTVNTRLPDGSSPNIDSKNLIDNGGAEQQCATLQTEGWWTEPTYLPLTIAYRNNNSCITMRPSSNNNCFFQATLTSRLIQDIDVTKYSTLIDNNQAWFNLSAYMGCTDASSNEWSTVEVRFANERKIYGNYPVHVMQSRRSWRLSWNDSLIPIRTRSVRITIGATVLNSSACCAIDDVKVNILQKIGANNTFI